jgi:hypothetical protein
MNANGLQEVRIESNEVNKRRGRKLTNWEPNANKFKVMNNVNKKVNYLIQGNNNRAMK